MPVTLPEFDPVVFDESPLGEVVCQLRFNPVLKIAVTQPADFQDRIRTTFPLVSEERGIQVGLAGNQPILSSPEAAWQFKTEDSAWIVSLSANFIALKTIAYEHFRGFLDHLMPVVAAFESIYSPGVYTRVGLRYVNEIVRPRPVQWETLLNKPLLGIHADQVFRDGVVAAKHYYVLDAPKGQIGWRVSRDIGQLEDSQPAERFTLDFDHYTSGTIAPADVKDLLTGFNHTLYSLFRWCITEACYSAMIPRTKEKTK